MKRNLGRSIFLKGVTRDFAHMFFFTFSHRVYARLWGNRTHVIRVAIRADAKGKGDEP